MAPLLAPLLLVCLALVTLVQAVLGLLPATGLHGSQQLLLCMVITFLVAQLLGPLAQQRGSPGVTALSQALCAGVALLCNVAITSLPVLTLSAQPWLVCAGLMLLVLLSSLLQQLLTLRLQIEQSLAAAAVTIGMLTLMLAPLWLGPLAAASANHETVASLALLLSPLSLPAGLADIDFMRASWFYQYSPIASLSFDYPPLVLLMAFYGGLIVGARNSCQRALQTAPTCSRRPNHATD